jgi:hypothetical protein
MRLNVIFVCGEGNLDVPNLTLLPPPADRRGEVNGKSVLAEM